MFGYYLRNGLIVLVVAMMFIALFDQRVVTGFGVESGMKTVASGIVSILDGWVLWAVLGAIAVLPFLLALAIDGKGQSAAGWLVVMGMLLSALLAGGYLVLLAVWQLIRLFRLFAT